MGSDNFRHLKSSTTIEKKVWDVAQLAEQLTLN